MKFLTPKEIPYFITLIAYLFYISMLCYEWGTNSYFDIPTRFISFSPQSHISFAISIGIFLFGFYLIPSGIVISIEAIIKLKIHSRIKLLSFILHFLVIHFFVFYSIFYYTTFSINIALIITFLLLLVSTFFIIWWLIRRFEKEMKGKVNFNYRLYISIILYFITTILTGYSSYQLGYNKAISEDIFYYVKEHPDYLIVREYNNNYIMLPYDYENDLFDSENIMFYPINKNESYVLQKKIIKRNF